MKADFRQVFQIQGVFKEVHDFGRRGTQHAAKGYEMLGGS